jgi:hypothetical protein
MGIIRVEKLWPRRPGWFQGEREKGSPHAHKIVRRQHEVLFLYLLHRCCLDRQGCVVSTPPFLERMTPYASNILLCPLSLLQWIWHQLQVRLQKSCPSSPLHEPYGHRFPGS